MTGTYRVQDENILGCVLANGSEITPMLTLKDEYGGTVVFYEDDHCLLLGLLKEEGYFEPVTHWFKEAAEAAREHQLDKLLHYP